MNEVSAERTGSPDMAKIIYVLYLVGVVTGVTMIICAGILTVVLIGILLFFVIAVWWIVRCVKGLKYLDQKTAYANYESWAF
jgi:uncharacterized membrane protein